MKSPLRTYKKSFYFLLFVLWGGWGLPKEVTPRPSVVGVGLLADRGDESVALVIMERVSIMFHDLLDDFVNQHAGGGKCPDEEHST
jgi:hypothetical protein